MIMNKFKFSKCLSKPFMKPIFSQKYKLNQLISRSFCYFNNFSIESLLRFQNKPIEQTYIHEKVQIDDLSIEFTSETDWEKTVLQSKIPVVIDFYADWCKPCKQLFDLLNEQLEKKRNFKLIKINIDQHQNFAENLGIESIPTVFLLNEGEVVESFIGLPQEKKLADFFETIHKISNLFQDKNYILGLLKSAEENIQSKNWEIAVKILLEADSLKYWENNYGIVIKTSLAYCYFNQNDFDQSMNLIQEIHQRFTENLSTNEEIKQKILNLETKIKLKKNPDLLQKEFENLEDEIENNPQNMEIRYKLAVRYFENTDFENALATLLEILKIERNWNNGAANIMINKIFEILGSNSHIVINARANLEKILF